MNSRPHVGHAFEFILGDALARTSRRTRPTHFNIGLDEHGVKVWEKARSLNQDPTQYVDALCSEWIDFCEQFRISYDSFYRTSSDEHARFVTWIWTVFSDAGLIYKGSYHGTYCKGCESFKTDRDLRDGRCPDHPGVEPEAVREENYFFRLSELRTPLLAWLDGSPDFLVPRHKRAELRNQISGAADLSISRPVESCGWGIQVPGDPTQVVYVWFDALLNYIAAAGYGTESFCWDDVTQLCGPDNIRFQGLVFQSFLLALGVRQTDRLIVHGTILDEYGRKMSKSTGNVIDPSEQVSKYGVDAVRYYALGGLNSTADSCWSESELVALWNSDVCNEWGNLVTRVLHLLHLKGHTPRPHPGPDTSEIHAAWRVGDSKEAVGSIRRIVKAANKTMNDRKPWSSPDWAETLDELYAVVVAVNEEYRAVVPDACSRVDAALAAGVKAIIFNKL